MPPKAPTRPVGAKRWFSGRALRGLRSGSVVSQAPAQPALDEGVDRAVEHRLGVAYLQPGPHIFDERVRLQHVITDLRPELGRHDLSSDLIQVLRRLLLLALEQTRLEHLHRHLSVLELRALVLTGDDDSRGQVRDANGGVRLVDVLTSGAG